ncbi:protein kinase domain-containing protein [Sorangium sp. So ce861]|uniref:serine/threonine-protein kinase n=1 Tax=Sorangium sp. So ce861 TaxID=3133323 RepID=UPI003F62BB14
MPVTLRMAGDAPPEMTDGESEAAELFHREDIPQPHGGALASQPPPRSDAPSAHGSVPPVHGSGLPAYGSVPPVHGSGPPAYGSVPPVHGSGPPAYGSVPPVHASVPPVHGSVPPVHGSVPPAYGSAPPLSPRGSAPPARGSAPPLSPRGEGHLALPPLPPLPARGDGFPARRGKVKQVPRARRCPTCKLTFSGDSRFCPFDGDPLADAPDWNPSADPLLGRTIDGRYEVQAVVGEGGMGTVYEVRHKSLGRLFALKVLRRDIAQDAELVARFIQEAKAAAAIGHPNIVAVSDFGAIEVEPGQPELPFFVMEFLTGTSLAALLRTERTLPAPRVGEIMLQCAAALGAAHAAGVIHRDLKPDNVYLVRNGDQEFVKLLDFGVAKVAGGKRLTRIGMVFGTPHYMSPEQAEGKRIDARADIYALGVLMYECFAGRVPFEADTYMGVLTKHMYMSPEPLEQVMPDASALGAFGPIVMRCLAKNPEERFSSMADLAAAIELAIEAPSRAAAALLQDETPRREALKLREHDEMLGAVQVPREPSEPLSMAARVAIALAAILVPIAIALGFRALRASAREAPPETAAPGALHAATAVGAATDEPPSPPVAPAPSAAAAPLAQDPEPPRPHGTASAAPVKPAAPTARPSAPPVSPSRPTATGDIIDPWQR